MFLNKQTILYKKQLGSQHNHSTTHALLEITKKIKQGCNSGKYTCGMFLDLQIAFDIVNHDVLLTKL